MGGDWFVCAAARRVVVCGGRSGRCGSATPGACRELCDSALWLLRRCHGRDLPGVCALLASSASASAELGTARAGAQRSAGSRR
jgi:hypothetical protein